MNLILYIPLQDWLSNWYLLAIVTGVFGAGICIGMIISETRTLWWKYNYRERVKGQEMRR